jgi:catechol 2,3-dioxygenase-like lactoylglutathione lyase family enzyme
VRKSLLLFIPFVIGFAQILAPNDSGVAMGHLHLKVRDVEAQTRFWVNVLGGAPSILGHMEMVTLPGVIILWEKGKSKGGMEGSVVGQLGFKVRNLNEVLARAKANGITINTVQPPSAFLTAPDDVRVELIEDKALAAAAAHHHVHFFSAAPKNMQAWYAKTFGNMPGANLTFLQADSPTVGTARRSLDHIGFEVKNLEAFTKKLEAQGVRFDIPYRRIRSLNLAVAFFTDPWGTCIELTEGLNAQAR